VDTLIAAGANSNAITLNGSTPLLRACYKEHVELATRLIEVHAQVLVQDTSGYSPLHWACARNSIALVELLLQHGAQPHIHIFNNDGFLPHLLVDLEGTDASAIMVCDLIHHSCDISSF
jgi:ankyrin repeat protein